MSDRVPERFVTELDLHRKLSAAEPGCLSFSVKQSEADPLCYDVEELFVDRAALQAHGERLRASSWWSVTKDFERSYTVEDV